MTVHLTDAQELRLEHLASQFHQTPDQLAQEAVDRFLTYREQLTEAVEVGRASASRGELMDHKDVMEMMDEIISNG